MGPKIKKNTLYAKVFDQKIVVVEISIQPECLHLGQSLKENKTNSLKWFTKEHFDRLILKLEDVILAKVCAPSEAHADKKKSGKISRHPDCPEMLPDPELCIQYQFVKKTKYKQTVLIRRKQESVVDGLRKTSEQSGYSGGGHRSYVFFPEKLIVSVSLALQVAHQMPPASGVIQDAAGQQPAPSKSTISKYFNRDPACITHSTQKKRATLKNMNQKSEAQKNVDTLFCSSSSTDVEFEVNEKNTKKCIVCKQSEGGTCGKPDQIFWVKELGSEIDSQQGRRSKVEKPEEHDNGVLSKHADGGNYLLNDSSENCSIVTGVCPKSEETRATIWNKDAGSLKDVKNCGNVDADLTAFTSSDSSGIESIPLRARLSRKNTHKKPKTACDDEATGKGKEIDSITDATEVDSIPLNSQLSKKNAVKKPKIVSDDEPTDKRKEEDSITDSTQTDSTPLSPRFSKKNTIKRPKITLDNEAVNRREERDSLPESDSTDVDSVPPHTRMLKKNFLKKSETASTRSNEATGKRKGEDSITNPTDVDSIPLCALLSKNGTVKKPKIASSDETSGIGNGTDSIADATEVNSVPLSSRLSKRNALKKVKTASGDEAACQRKGTDLIAVKIGDDNDFESPKAGRSATGKRKGSDLSDDQDLLTSVFSTDSQTSSTSNREAKAGLNSKKRKMKKGAVRVDVSERKVLQPAKKRITKRQMKSANRTAAETLEDAFAEPGSSPLEPITIEEKPPVTLDVSTIEELTAEQTEYLVWEHAGKLRDIFEGKVYNRRHEDYKAGGKARGDLAFQVLFGPFSEEQRDIIMEVLTSMFCYKHSKYFDYVSKVLLPETLVMLYMKVVGKTEDEAELSLLEAPASTSTN